jgi:hypothetical protein
VLHALAQRLDGGVSGNGNHGKLLSLKELQGQTAAAPRSKPHIIALHHPTRHSRGSGFVHVGGFGRIAVLRPFVHRRRSTVPLITIRERIAFCSARAQNLFPVSEGISRGHIAEAFNNIQKRSNQMQLIHILDFTSNAAASNGPSNKRNQTQNYPIERDLKNRIKSVGAHKHLDLDLARILPKESRGKKVRVLPHYRERRQNDSTKQTRNPA